MTTLSKYILALALILIPISASADLSSLSTGLVGYWPLNLGDYLSSTKIIDRTGNGGTGTLVNSPTKVPLGLMGQALSFNGSTQYVNASGTTATNLTGAMTLTGWIYPTTVTGEHRMIAKWGGPQVDQQYLCEQDANKILFALFKNGNYYILTSTTSVIPVNKWSMISCVYDGSTMYVYLNATIDSTTQANSAGTQSIPGDNVGIGTDLPSPESYFQGNMDELRIYNRALSAAEIKSLYLLGNTSHTK